MSAVVKMQHGTHVLVQPVSRMESAEYLARRQGLLHKPIQQHKAKRSAWLIKKERERKQARFFRKAKTAAYYSMVGLVGAFSFFCLGAVWARVALFWFGGM